MILLNCIFEGSNLQKWEKGKKTSTVMSLKITGDITKKARFYRTFLWLYLFCTTILVGEGGFEPPKSVTTDLQSAPFGHSGILPYKAYSIGAGGRIRTPDLLITNQLLYQLSYTSVFRCFTRDFVLFLYLSLTAHI